MKKFSKSYQEKSKLIDNTRLYSINEALNLLKKTSTTNFDSSVDINFSLNVDPKRTNQQVRGVLTLPNGTGRKTVILVLTENKQKEAKEAGADFVGADELITKIKNGNWFKYDVVVATPEIMPKLISISRLLGPKKLMPSIKNNTITENLTETIAELKKGKIFYRVDKFANINTLIGKVSFSEENLLNNYTALLNAIRKTKPPETKGRYIKKIALSTTMGPSIPVQYDLN